MSGEALGGSTLGAMNKSGQVLARFADCVRNREQDMSSLLDAMKEDAWVASGEVPETFSVDGQYKQWSSFCDQYAIDGERFKRVLAPLMDLPTGAFAEDGTQYSLRDLGGDNYLLKIDFLDVDKPAISLWMRCAMYLARNPDYPLPACMMEAE